MRGAEVVDLLAALNTGHEGGCGTLHANSAADVPARLEALGVAQGDLGVGGVQAPDVAVGQTPAGSHEDLPERPDAHVVPISDGSGAHWARLAACAPAASRTQAPSMCARRRQAMRCRLHGPSPLITRMSSSKSGAV